VKKNNLKFTHAVYICLHKETAVENALRYDFVLLSPARLTEFEGENSLYINAFSKKIF